VLLSERYLDPKESIMEMNRRDFIRKASRVAALGGGLYLLGAGRTADAAVEAREALQRWGNPWRPASPKRLSDTAHDLARRALGGEHGRAMVRTDFALDDALLTGLSPDMRYGHACKRVAEKAPLRLLPGEKVVGSSTLIEAPGHATPVANIASVSHTTLGFDKVLKHGYRGLRDQIRARLARGGFEAVDQSDKTVAGPEGRRAIRTGGHWWEAAGRAEYDSPPLTIECWAKLDSKNAFNVLVLNRNKDSRRHWELYSYAGSGVFSAYIPGYAPAEIKSDRDICDGKWHYLAMTFDGAQVRLFVDGSLVKEETVRPESGMSEGGGGLYFGKYPPHNIGCDGAIGEVRLSNRVREIGTPPEGPMATEADTIGLWRIEAGDPEGALRDASPLRNDSLLVAARRGADLLEAMLLCLDAAETWHRRYMALLDNRIASSTGAERENYLEVREALRNVPENPASNFREAVQSLWFAYAFQRLMGTWSGLGRIDEILGPYLERDLAEGRITLDEARELLAHFWIKGCEWIGAFDTRGSGDAQHYQNIILSGVDASGRDITNPVTYLVLDIVEELHISDFPIAVRVSERSPDRLLQRIAEVQRHGGGIVALYNEDVVIEGLVKFGYSLEEARGFANDGCWEVLIPGKTTFSYVPFDALVLLHETLGVTDAEKSAPEYDSFDALYAAYLARLRRQIDHHHNIADGWSRNGHPTPLVSLLVDDCIEKGRSYFDRGSHYTVLAPHAGRLANVANSLQVIKRLVYEDASLGLPELAAILRDDWKGQETLRQRVLNRFTFYGNDDAGADAMMRRVFHDYTAIVEETREREGVLRPAGISTFGREIEWSMNPHSAKATADGHRAGAVLATNCSPSPGTDRKGPTAVINSYCKLDFTRTPNGATLELKIHPESVKGEAGRDALVALMRGFIRQGGWFLHVDVVDSAMLLDAQRHPENYPNLAVRIAGWSARFATLDEHWQNMVIARTQQFA
jgi:pyruvate-formate lyase